MAELLIKGMRFYGHHGVYEFERKQGGWYEVDVLISWEPDAAGILRDELASTVNYEEIYAVVKGTFDTPANLIEKLAILIYEAVLPVVAKDGKVKVNVRKYSPPIAGEVQYAEFSWDGR